LKPDGWAVEMLSIEPEKLIVGERKIVIGCVGVAAGLIIIGATKFGAYWEFFAAAGIGFFVGSMALVYRAWKHDPWLSGVYDRFRRYPSFIPSHASIASSDSQRAFYRSRKHLVR
jgi:type IV secretory pathway TrbD component